MSALILASNSPRRRELLATIAENFLVEPSRFEERAEGFSARGKAEEVFSRFPACTVRGADTVVSCGGEILGKPADDGQAAQMLRFLSGKTHSVFTGVCLLAAGFREERTVETKVVFYDLTEELIQAYVRSGKPRDKAGAYGIQDGYPLVKRYEGSYTNVMGLPVEEVRAMLAARGGNKW